MTCLSHSLVTVIPMIPRVAHRRTVYSRLRTGSRFSLRSLSNMSWFAAEIATSSRFRIVAGISFSPLSSSSKPGTLVDINGGSVAVPHVIRSSPMGTRDVATGCTSDANSVDQVRRELFPPLPSFPLWLAGWFCGIIEARMRMYRRGLLLRPRAAASPRPHPIVSFFEATVPRKVANGVQYLLGDTAQSKSPLFFIKKTGSKP